MEWIILLLTTLIFAIPIGIILVDRYKNVPAISYRIAWIVQSVLLIVDIILIVLLKVAS